MADFSQALPIVLHHEGGLVDDPNDRGGITNLGLTLLDLTRFYGRPATTEEINNCSESQAEIIYKTLFWDPMLLDQAISQNEALCLFDQGVLSGQPTVVKFTQEILGFTDQNIDGIMGPKTLAALNNAVESTFLLHFLTVMKSHYLEIGNNDPSQNKFLAGWLNRLQDLCVRTNIELGG